ncbi:glycosyltransferase family protein [Salegentibacter sediminis]|uniref:glycosyltransferase family protein n=1 Tax=Salegentibacter sediminis TaxID=1930251 RepID=UPI0009C0CE3A|nr:glycosyltransferase [Salegentibacter sediminis]
MKILYINANLMDYQQDIIYGGLVKVLGAKNVHPIPFNHSFYFNLRKYPKNIGYHQGGLFAYLKNRFLSFNYDCVIVSSTKYQSFDFYSEILDKIPDSCPVAFLDGGDRAEIGGDLSRLGYPKLYQETIKKRPFDLIFKREMLKNVDYPTNVYPCPFAFNMDRIKSIKKHTTKKYDVSFWANESHKSRTKIFSLLKGKYDCEENGTIRGFSFGSFQRRGNYYFEELKRCKVVLNIRGAGWDTLRFWEVPALSTFMLSQKPDIMIPNDFTDEMNIAYFEDDFSDFYEKIDYYLENESVREKIAFAGYQHLCKYHTDIARAKSIINRISSL